jgi:hypothetical protein
MISLSKSHRWEIYRDSATKLIEKDTVSEQDLSQIIQDLLIMSTDV